MRRRRCPRARWMTRRSEASRLPVGAGDRAIQRDRCKDRAASAGIDCVAPTESSSARLVLGQRCRIRRQSITLADRAGRSCSGRNGAAAVPAVGNQRCRRVDRGSRRASRSTVFASPPHGQRHSTSATFRSSDFETRPRLQTATSGMLISTRDVVRPRERVQADRFAVETDVLGEGAALFLVCDPLILTDLGRVGTE